jgi:hypothetical protein
MGTSEVKKEDWAQKWNQMVLEEKRKIIVEELTDHLFHTNVSLKDVLNQLTHRELEAVELALRTLFKEFGQIPEGLPPLPPIREGTKEVGGIKVTHIPGSQRKQLEERIFGMLDSVLRISEPQILESKLKRFNSNELDIIFRGVLIIADKVDQREKQVKK